MLARHSRLHHLWLGYLFVFSSSFSRPSQRSGSCATGSLSLSVFNISKGFAPRVLPLWEVAFLVHFSRVDRLVVNCIAYGVEDSNIDQHWEFLVFYLFFLHLFWLENTTKTSHSWERRRSGELEGTLEITRERPVQTPASILNGRWT